MTGDRISIKRVGPHLPTYTFRNGRVETGVWRLVHDNGPNAGDCAGYAVKIDNGKHGGYVIVNEDGDTVVGSGRSTMTGATIGDAIFALVKHLFSERAAR